MPILDLTRFYGIDHPHRYTSPALDIVREQFAAAITAYALHCRNNIELLDALYLAMPPESGFPFPRKLGEGSTRRAYLLPFGLVLKLERTDRPTSEELESRGSLAYLLRRRRESTFGQVMASIAFPNLCSRIYGFTLAFGIAPVNPACLVCEDLTPLSTLRPEDDLLGIANIDLAVSRDWCLKVFDGRFAVSEASPTDKPLRDVIPSPERGVWTGNIGIDAMGRYKFLDMGDFVCEDFRLDQALYPKSKDGPIWEPCVPLSHQHIRQTLQVSEALKRLYDLRRHLAQRGGEQDHGHEPNSHTQYTEF